LTLKIERRNSSTMPNVNGYQLREAIRKWELRRVTLANQFTDVLTAYPNEKKPKPEAVAEDLLVAENAVAQLQTAQQEYNLAVTVDVQGTKMTLAHAVKLIGGAGRPPAAGRRTATSVTVPTASATRRKSTRSGKSLSKMRRSARKPQTVTRARSGRRSRRATPLP
jgi:hypothetical protein